jgi:uncharacterized protein (TIGR03083 family)
VAARDLTKRVPSCPDWNVAELVRHTAVVYLHKAECMRSNAFPDPWPPAEIANEDPIALFDRAYADLHSEFAKHDPSEQSITWYDDEQTVGFWIRRMAQETVIHRVDAELAQDESFAEIPDDLAVDGIDEILVRFLAFQFTKWAHELQDELKDADDRRVGVRTDGSSWVVRASREGVSVEAGSDEAAATVSGDPAGVLLWLWRRTDDGAVNKQGDPALIAQLHKLLGDATQ